MTVEELKKKLQLLNFDRKGDYEIKVDDVIYSHQKINSELEVDDKEKTVAFTTTW